MRLTKLPVRLTIRSRALLLVLAFARVIAVLAALQVSGAVHGAADAWAAISGAQADDECDQEAGGKQCPPGCPNCHCFCRTIVAAPEAFSAVAVFTRAEGDSLNVFVGEHERVQGPNYPPLYRPPRGPRSA